MEQTQKAVGGWMTPPLEELVRRLYLKNLTGRNVDLQSLRRDLTPRSGRLVAGLLLLIPIITAPLAIHFIFSHFRAESRRKENAQALGPILRARVRIAWPIMVNRGFLTGDLDPAPGLFLAVADHGPDVESDVMMPILERMERAHAAAIDPIDRFLAEVLADTLFKPDRRRFIPVELTGGRAIGAFDVVLKREWFAAELKEMPWVPCLVEPGPKGQISIVPFQVLAEALREARRLGILMD